MERIEHRRFMKFYQHLMIQNIVDLNILSIQRFKRESDTRSRRLSASPTTRSSARSIIRRFSVPLVMLFDASGPTRQEHHPWSSPSSLLSGYDLLRFLAAFKANCYRCYRMQYERRASLRDFLQISLFQKKKSKFFRASFWQHWIGFIRA